MSTTKSRGELYRIGILPNQTDFYRGYHKQGFYYGKAKLYTGLPLGKAADRTQYLAG